MRPAAVVPLDLARVRFPHFHPLAGTRGIVRGFVIVRERGHLLVDTGVGTGNADIERWYGPEVTPLAAALAGSGLAPGAIAAIVHTHLHFDHIGQDRSFAGVPVYVQEAEVAAARADGYTVPEWLPEPGRLETVEGDRSIAPGVHLIATPGHTPGHQSVLVEPDAGVVIIAGQAIYSAAEYRHVAATRSLPAGAGRADPAAALASALRLVDVRAARLLFSHDADEA
jgi:glyoxylase-like metal-dependent hydrolase (beta-lactamase superfamily II)